MQRLSIRSGAAAALVLTAYFVVGCASGASSLSGSLAGGPGTAAGGAAAGGAPGGSLGVAGSSGPSPSGSGGVPQPSDGGGAASVAGGTGGTNNGATAAGGGGASGGSSAGSAGSDSPDSGVEPAGGSGGGGGTGSRNLSAFMVITGTGTPTPGDLIMIGRVKAHGFGQFTTVTDAAVTAQSVSAADLVVISSSAESGPLKNKLKDVAVPVLVIEDAEFSMMGMAVSGNHDANVAQLAIVAGGSPLVGAATGTVTISSKPGDLGWAAGTSAGAVLVGATMVGNAAHAAIFGYAKGAQMPGMVAPARRAGFAIRETLAANLNADGIKLFDSILEWVIQ